MTGAWSWAIGAVAVAGLGAVWVLVQDGWRRTFPHAARDPDVLADRRGCRGGCDCNDERGRGPAEGRPVGEEKS